MTGSPFQKGKDMRKRFMKKCISFLLVMLLCASFLPMCVFAAEPRQARGLFTISDLWINLQYGTYDLNKYVALDYKEYPLTWSSSDASIVAVDEESGQAELLNAGGCTTIRAELPDHAYGTFQVHIYQIVVDNPSIEMKLGDTVQDLAYLIADRDDMVLTYSSRDESIVTVDESGAVRAVGKGQAVIDIGVRGTKLTETVNVIVSDPEAVLPADGNKENDDPKDGKTDSESEGQNDDESAPGTVSTDDGGSGSDGSGTGDTGTTGDNQETTAVDQTDTGSTKAESKTTVTKTTVKTSTVTKTASSSDAGSVSTDTPRNNRPVATQNDTQVAPAGETAAVPPDVINEPSVPTAAYVNPAGGGNGILPSADTMASHVGAVAGMLAAVAAFGTAGMVKAYKLKKYESEV